MEKQHPNQVAVVCYMDTRIRRFGYKELPFSCIEQWKSENPDFTVTRIFDAAMDQLGRDRYLEQGFLDHHQRYNVPEYWLYADFKDQDGNMFRLLGIDPSKRKYKFIMLNTLTGSRIKATRQFLDLLLKI